MITFSSQLWIAPPPLELGIVCVLFWKKQFSKSKKIPVFYIEESNKIKAIGLTQIEFFG